MYRCAMCPSAYCEDHVPTDHTILLHYPFYASLGYDWGTSAVYIFCGPDCAREAVNQENGCKELRGLLTGSETGEQKRGK